MPVEALLIVVAFAGLPSLVPGVVCGVVGLALVGLMLFHQVGAGYPVQLAPAYRSSDQVALQLREAGATPNRVMSTSWNFYDTRSPWHERYRHVPIYVNSVDVLVREMRRQGAAYLVFDRQAGADQWPRLAGLLETEHPHAGLRALQPALRTDGSPPNLVAIYKLE